MSVLLDYAQCYIIKLSDSVLLYCFNVAAPRTKMAAPYGGYDPRNRGRPATDAIGVQPQAQEERRVPDVAGAQQASEDSTSGKNMGILQN